MKKLFGFTLAEVLITLGILGVIAAVTLPAVKSNVDKNQWTVGLKTSVNVIERAFAQMLADENEETLDLTELWADKKSDIMKEYFKVSKVKTGKQSKDIYTFGTNTSFDGVDDYQCYMLVNGQFMYIKYDYDAQRGGIFADIYVDVNGKKLPNMLGKDIYAFGLSENAVLLPYGSDELNELDSTKYIKWNTDDGCKGNANSIKDGRTCTARIIENDYQMDY